MIKGHCLCGGVEFELEPDKIVLFNNCYCKKCQRYSGAGFVSQLQVAKSGFTWSRGQELIKEYESSPGVFRAFCDCCGSPLPIATLDDFVPVPAGLLDEEPNSQPRVNMHLSSRARWAVVTNRSRAWKVKAHMTSGRPLCHPKKVRYTKSAFDHAVPVVPLE